MQLSRAEFDRRLSENTLRIAFVGMSNIGKSYTGSRLADAFDFTLIQVDKLIWESLGQGSMADFANWQGQPYSKGYAEREAQSIELESQATDKALNLPLQNAILDTTGSVVYTSEDVQDKIIRDWYIVHISASEDDIDRLKSIYFKYPKPLIWNGHYKCKPGQTADEAILSSYPNLLDARSKAYAALADKTVRSETILDPKNTIEEIFEALKPAN